MMIDVKNAVKLAKKYIDTVYDGEKLEALLLEEIYLDEDQKNWIVTLGFNDFSQPETKDYKYLKKLAESSPTFQNYEALKRIPRAYKQFKIDAESGDFNGMHIRELA